MAKAYYSTILNNSADEVWSHIRDFNDDRWSGVVTESYSENDKSGSTIGTIRYHKFGNKVARSDLRAYSEAGRYFTYGFIGTPPISVDNYQATVRVTPIIDGDRAFIEWKATFDCIEPEREHWAVQLHDMFARWFEALRKDLDNCND